MNDPALPRGCTLIHNGERFKVRCSCDWSASASVESYAVALVVGHATYDPWCYVHRNLTPIGAEPTMTEEER